MIEDTLATFFVTAGIILIIIAVILNDLIIGLISVTAFNASAAMDRESIRRDIAFMRRNVKKNE